MCVLTYHSGVAAAMLLVPLLFAQFATDSVMYLRGVGLDVNTLHRDEDADSLSLNEIGRVTLRTTAPLFFDDYRRNRATGSFILVDEPSNDTLAAGMIL